MLHDPHQAELGPLPDVGDHSPHSVPQHLGPLPLQRPVLLAVGAVQAVQAVHVKHTPAVYCCDRCTTE